MNASALKLFFDVCNHGTVQSCSTLAVGDRSDAMVAEVDVGSKVHESLATTIVAGVQTYLNNLLKMFGL